MGGDIAIPGRSEGAAPLELPVPVALGDNRWGLLWAESYDHGHIEGELPPTFYTRLRFSERVDGAWTRPIDLVSAPLRITWEAHRTIHHLTGAGAHVMVLAMDSSGRWNLMFGPVDSLLDPIPLGSDVEPQVGTFVPRPAGGITVFAQVARGSGDRQRQELVLLKREADSWSEPEVISKVPSRVQRLRSHRDQDGALHLIWTTTGSEPIQHLTRAAGSERWIPHEFHIPGLVFRWVSGVDRCGRLSLITWSLDDPNASDRKFHFHRSYWTANEWTALRPVWEEFDGFYLFDGIGLDSTWRVGWSGAPLDVADAENEAVRLWLTTP